MRPTRTISRHDFTVDDFHRMGEAGILRPEDRVELIEGALIDTTPIGHASKVMQLTMLSNARHGIPEVWLIDVQQERVEVYREPGRDGYHHLLRPDNTEQIAPISLPDVSIALDQLWSGRSDA